MKDDVTKLLIGYAKSGGSMKDLENEMIKDVVRDLKKYIPTMKKNEDELNSLARDLVRSHIAKRIAEKLK